MFCVGWIPAGSPANRYALAFDLARDGIRSIERAVEFGRAVLPANTRALTHTLSPLSKCVHCGRDPVDAS